MTIDAIIAHVAETPGWFLDAVGGVRRWHNDYCACPISSLGDAPACDYAFVADRFGLGDVSEVVYAADHTMAAIQIHTFYSRRLVNTRLELRRRLLGAAKLSEIS